MDFPINFLWGKIRIFFLHFRWLECQMFERYFWGTWSSRWRNLSYWNDDFMCIWELYTMRNALSLLVESIKYRLWNFKNQLKFGLKTFNFWHENHTNDLTKIMGEVRYDNIQNKIIWIFAPKINDYIYTRSKPLILAIFVFLAWKFKKLKLNILAWKFIIWKISNMAQIYGAKIQIRVGKVYV